MRLLPTIITAITLALSGCGGSGSTGPVGQSPSLSITIATNPMVSGTSAQASATITDASGNASPASGVVWSSSAPAVADVNASGLVSGGVAGTATISATAGGVTGYVLVIVTPGAPASVTIYSGDSQSGIQGSQLPAPLCVLVKDARGNVVPGVVATYSVATGGGTLSAPTAPSTDGLGVATSGLWSLGALVGEQTVVASVSGAGSVTFKATAQSRVSLRITIATNPIASGTSAQASATITDASGNTSPASGVTWSSSTPSVADVDASGLVTGSLVGNATIRATAGGVTGQASVIVTAGAPASVSIYAGNFQSGIVGTRLPDPLCVLVKDASGNVVPRVVAVYTVATGGGTLGAPTTPSTDDGGVAISGLWTLGSLVGQQTVVASVSGAGSVTFSAAAR